MATSIPVNGGAVGRIDATFNRGPGWTDGDEDAPLHAPSPPPSSPSPPPGRRTPPPARNWNLPQQEAVADAGVLPAWPTAASTVNAPLTGAQLADALTVITGEPRRRRLGREALRHRLRRAPGARPGSGRRRGARATHRARSWTEAAEQLRHRSRRPLPRPAHESPGRRRRARALPVGADHPRRGRALAGDAARRRRLGGEHAREQLLASACRATARARSARCASRSARSACRTSGAARPTAVKPLRLSGPRRLRLLRLRLARLQALRPARRQAHRRPHRRADGGRDPQAERRRTWTTIRPGDLLFFGRACFGAKATEAGVDHVGIALSEHWMIHSSAQGVYVSSLDEDWRRDRFTWARRVL